LAIAIISHLLVVGALSNHFTSGPTYICQLLASRSDLHSKLTVGSLKREEEIAARSMVQQKEEEEIGIAENRRSRTKKILR